jgi:hypothetical protein
MGNCRLASHLLFVTAAGASWPAAEPRRARPAAGDLAVRAMRGRFRAEYVM